MLPFDKDDSFPWFLALAAFLICALGWTNPFVLDDLSKIVHNPDIRHLGNIFDKLIYPYNAHVVLERNDPSRPLVFFFYTLLYSLSDGPSPFLFHLFSSLLHVFNCGAVYWLVHRVARNSMIPSSRALARVTALFFALSPLQTGNVLYAYALSDLLGAALIFSALFLHTRARTWAVLLFALSLGAKQSCLVFPLLMLLTESTDSTSTPQLDRRKVWKEIWPYGVVAVLYLVYRYVYFGALGDLEGEGNTHDRWTYLSTQGILFWKYWALAWFPKGLAVDHHILPQHLSNASRILGGTAFLLLCGYVGSRFLRRSSTPPKEKFFTWAFLWFLVNWLPTSSFLPTVDLFVERRVYLANAGTYALGAGFLVSWLMIRNPRVTRTLVVGWMLLFASISIWRSRVFHEPETLWQEVLSSYPQSPRALNNLGTYYIESHQCVKARDTFRSLLDTYPQDAYALANMGSLLSQESCPELYNLSESEKALKAALALNPNLVEAHYNLGRCSQLQNKLPQAEEAYAQALALNPQHVPSLNNLGLLFMHLRRTEKARAYFQEALAIDPTYAPAWKNLNLAESSPAPSNGPQPPPGSRAVPLDQVPPELIIQTYRNHLKKNPKDQAARKAFAKYCKEHHLTCETSGDSPR